MPRVRHSISPTFIPWFLTFYFPVLQKRLQSVSSSAAAAVVAATPTTESDGSVLILSGDSLDASTEFIPDSPTTKRLKSNLPEPKSGQNSVLTPSYPPLNSAAGPTSQLYADSPALPLSGSIPSNSSTPTSITNSSILFTRVIAFLKEFRTVYIDAMVACARKTDPACWPTLFNPTFNADSPKILFEVR